MTSQDAFIQTVLTWSHQRLSVSCNRTWLIHTPDEVVRLWTRKWTGPTALRITSTAWSWVALRKSVLFTWSTINIACVTIHVHLVCLRGVVLAWLSGRRALQTCITISIFCFSKIQTGFTFLVPAYPGSPGQRAVKRVCVCVSLYQIPTFLELQ